MRALIAFWPMGAALVASAQAQTLAPMEATVATRSGEASLRLRVANPYKTRQRFEVTLWNPDGSQVEAARLSRASLTMAPNGAAPLTVRLPVPKGAPSRTFYVCVSSKSFQRPSGAGIRGQVCGRYHAIRRR